MRCACARQGARLAATSVSEGLVTNQERPSITRFNKSSHSQVDRWGVFRSHCGNGGLGRGGALPGTTRPRVQNPAPTPFP